MRALVLQKQMEYPGFPFSNNLHWENNSTQEHGWQLSNAEWWPLWEHKLVIIILTFIFLSSPKEPGDLGVYVMNKKCLKDFNTISSQTTLHHTKDFAMQSSTTDRHKGFKKAQQIQTQIAFSGRQY